MYTNQAYTCRYTQNATQANLFYKWRIKLKITDKQYYMDGYLKENLDHLKKAVKKNWDGILIIDGIEGAAKTTQASAVCYYLDQRYNLDSVVFTQKQFMDAVDKAPPGSAIHWDEFLLSGMSTEAMTAAQNTLIKKMTIIRKKNLYIVLLASWIFMLRIYFAVGRSRALIHCYSPDGISRGYFSFYNYKSKKALYLNGKKRFNYNIQKPDFIGRFTDTFGLFWDINEYDQKKEKAIISLTSQQEEKVTPSKEKALYKAIGHLKQNMNNSEIARILAMPESNIRYWLAAAERQHVNNLQ